MHARKLLPIGIQTFAKIREDDCYYVDKTGFVRQLIAAGSQYFLSRPGRFGKSLLMDTIAEVFAGNEPLFRGLEIHPHWDWSVRFPVIRLSFAEGVLHSRAALDARIEDLLRMNAEALEVTPHPGLDVPGTFGDLIRQARARHGQRVAVLVADDFAALHAHVQALFTAIPHHWHDNNPIARYEGFYASVFFSHIAALGLDLTPDDATVHGRIDLTLRFEARVWLFEFKVVELVPEGRALQQIKDRGYAEKYRALDQPMHLIGFESSREQRTLVGFEVETLARG